MIERIKKKRQVKNERYGCFVMFWDIVARILLRDEAEDFVFEASVEKVGEMTGPLGKVSVEGIGEGIDEIEVEEAEDDEDDEDWEREEESEVGATEEEIRIVLGGDRGSTSVGIGSSLRIFSTISCLSLINFKTQSR